MKTVWISFGRTLECPNGPTGAPRLRKGIPKAHFGCPPAPLLNSKSQYWNLVKTQLFNWNFNLQIGSGTMTILSGILNWPKFSPKLSTQTTFLCSLPHLVNSRATTGRQRASTCLKKLPQNDSHSSKLHSGPGYCDQGSQGVPPWGIKGPKMTQI